VVPYCAKAGFKPNFVFILQNLVHSNPKAGQEFASQLVKPEGGGPALVEIPVIIDVFMQFQRLQVRLDGNWRRSGRVGVLTRTHPSRGDVHALTTHTSRPSPATATRLPQECTAFLLDVLAGDKPEEGFLQTKLLEMNLLGGAPQVSGGRGRGPVGVGRR
jgi:clathrin heavy chain